MRQLFLIAGLLLGISPKGQATQGTVSEAQPLFRATKAPVELATARTADTQGLRLDLSLYESLRGQRPGNVSFELPFPGLGPVELTMNEFCNLSDDFTIARSTAEGTREEHYVPNLITYEVTGAEGLGSSFAKVTGIVVMFENYVQASLQLDGKQWELAPAKRPGDRETRVEDYVLFDVAKSTATNTFSCAVEDQEREMALMSRQQQQSLVPQCVEIGLDIDNFTRNTFADCYAAVDWGLGVLAGVDLVYRTELNDLITLQASYVNVWEDPEPWAGTVDNAGTMLDQLRVEWTSANAVLANANWDMIHLMSKRGDTGTGGIAYLGVVCSPDFACAFSSAMDNQSNFPVIPPNFTWNLFVVAHELGHNFGSNHTHWCGWPGGPDHPDEPTGSTGTIHDCFDSEGGCAETVINEQGTIMSYCHLQPAGAILEFHPVVEQAALFPTINANGSCHGNCAEIVISCEIGCTDSAACNDNAGAIEDDGSCAYVIDECGECGGNNESCGGCTNEASCNFDPSVTVDDGSCIVSGVTLTLTLLTDNYPGETTWSVVDANGTVMAEGGPYGSTQTTYVEEFCVGGGCHDLIFNDSYGDGMQYGGVVGDYQLTDPDGTILVQIVNGANFGFQAIDNFCVTPPTILGCTDPEACNYDSSAETDDGSCDPGTPVYFDSDGDGFGQFLAQYICGTVIPAGTVDLDGDCNDANSTIYPGAPGNATGIDNNCNGILDPDEEEPATCPEDVNADGAVSVADVLAVLSEFGCAGEACLYDVDGDDAVTVNDVLLVLSAFGTSCS